MTVKREKQIDWKLKQSLGWFFNIPFLHFVSVKGPPKLSNLSWEEMSEAVSVCVTSERELCVGAYVHESA